MSPKHVISSNLGARTEEEEKSKQKGGDKRGDKIKRAEMAFKVGNCIGEKSKN